MVFKADTIREAKCFWIHQSGTTNPGTNRRRCLTTVNKSGVWCQCSPWHLAKPWTSPDDNLTHSRFIVTVFGFSASASLVSYRLWSLMEFSKGFWQSQPMLKWWLKVSKNAWSPVKISFSMNFSCSFYFVVLNQFQFLLHLPFLLIIISVLK